MTPSVFLDAKIFGHDFSSKERRKNVESGFRDELAFEKKETWRWEKEKLGVGKKRILAFEKKESWRSKKRILAFEKKESWRSVLSTIFP